MTDSGMISSRNPETQLPEPMPTTPPLWEPSPVWYRLVSWLFARSEAALLLIDAHEGIKENSRRHGYMMRFLGIKNIAVCVNKMDLVKYDRQVFEQIKADYRSEEHTS